MFSGMSDFFSTVTSSRSLLRNEWKRPFSSRSWMLKLVSLTRRPMIDVALAVVTTWTASYWGSMSLEGCRIDSMMYSGRTAAGDAVEGRADPAALAVDGVALGALGLALVVEEELPARLGIARQVRLPGALARGAGQAADVQDQLGDLLLLERLAQLLHGRLGHAVRG